MGHVPHMVAENLFCKSFARCTKAAIADKGSKVYDPNHLKRYLSINHKFFNEKNNRRFCYINKLNNQRKEFKSKEILLIIITILDIPLIGQRLQ